MFQSFKGLTSHCVFDIWYVLQHMVAFCTHSMASLVLPEFLCKSKEVENAKKILFYLNYFLCSSF